MKTNENACSRCGCHHVKKNGRTGQGKQRYWCKEYGRQFLHIQMSLVFWRGLTRVLGEHVVDQALFARIYARHIRNEKAFWTPFPLPSIAADDPKFVHELPENSWGGASQALTALRAPRWFEHYG